MVGDPNMNRTKPANLPKPSPASIHRTTSPVISLYDDGGFVIDGVRCDGGMSILPDLATQQPRYSIAQHTSDTITRVDVQMFTPLVGRPHVVLIGVGATLAHPHYDLRQALQQLGVTGDILPTPGACRAWNLLLTEGRLLGFLALPTKTSQT